VELDGKIALVTGAAKRIGRRIALHLAGAGAEVAVHYNRSKEQADRTADEIRAAGMRAETFRADLADPRQIEAMFAAVRETFGRLDVLVNNASVFERTPIEGLTAEQWDAQLAVNARAPALCIRHALLLMADGGAIVNLTDTTALHARAAFPAYCASKAALTAVTQSAARALAPRGIRVNAVAPGVALWEKAVTDDQKQKVLSRVPMRRPGSPEDIAEAVLFLIRADYITGQTLHVDGGWSIA